MNRHAFVLLAALTACVATGGASPEQRTAVPADLRAFTGSWSATGSRQRLPTETDRPASILQLSGVVALTSGEGLGRGFLGEAIAYDDGRGASVGRAVWTDERGDRIYSEFRGEAIQTGSQITGVFTGGSGRYAGLSGHYAFTWQYVSQTEAGGVQGRSAGLAGQFRLAEAR